MRTVGTRQDRDAIAPRSQKPREFDDDPGCTASTEIVTDQQDAATRGCGSGSGRPWIEHVDSWRSGEEKPSEPSGKPVRNCTGTYDTSYSIDGCGNGGRNLARSPSFG